MRGYKDLTIVFYTFWLIGIATYFYLAFANIVHFLAAFLLLDLYMWLLASWVKKMVQKREEAMIAIYSQCHFGSFIEQYVPVHAKDTKNGIAGFYAFNLGNAYMHLGDLDKALQAYQRSEPKDVKRRFYRKQSRINDYLVWQAVYHNNLANVCQRHHDMEQAEKHVEELERTLHQIEALGDTYTELQIWIKTLSDCLFARKLEIELESGSLAAGENEMNRLQKNFEEGQTLVSRVYNRYLAGRIYERMGDHEQLRACKEYVRQNGGDSIYVKWAEG